MLERRVEQASFPERLAELWRRKWRDRVGAAFERDGQICRLQCPVKELPELCQWLTRDLGFVFATLIVQEEKAGDWLLLYVFYKETNAPWIYVEVRLSGAPQVVPSLSGLPDGPSFDWHEREAEDLFGLTFEGHPRLGEFVLHEDWPEGVNPMRRTFDAQQRVELRQPDPRWAAADHCRRARRLRHADRARVFRFRGIRALPAGDGGRRRDPHHPAIFLQIPRRRKDCRRSARSIASCFWPSGFRARPPSPMDWPSAKPSRPSAGIEVPPRARALRTVFAELERLRHHAAVDHRHLQLDGVGSCNQPGRADRRGSASAEL